MGLTAKQAYVLANIERVISLPPKIQSASPRRRFQLDGWECTPQITSLVVKKQLSHTSSGLAASSA